MINSATRNRVRDDAISDEPTRCRIEERSWSEFLSGEYINHKYTLSEEISAKSYYCILRA